MIKLEAVTRKSDEEDVSLAFDSLSALLKREELGFYQLAERNAIWGACENHVEKLKSKYEKLCVVGIGGSSLGARMLINSKDVSRNVEFFENVDGDAFWKKLDRIESEVSDWNKVHWLIISKSGGTMETLAQTQFVSQYLESKGVIFHRHATTVTEKKASALHDWSIGNGVSVLEVPTDVGGRFSAMTPVGLIPAGFAGLNLSELREGMKWGLMQDRMVAELAAQSLQSFRDEKWITLFWAYSDLLKDFGLWVQQLWAESLAKKLGRDGKVAPRVSTPIPLVGANDQHSVLQQVSEGARDKFVWFIRSKRAEEAGSPLKHLVFESQDYLQGKPLGALLKAEAVATRQAILENGTNSLTLLLDDTDERCVGALTIIFELVVGVLGEALNINAFDQPGVELGKTLAKSKLIN